MMNLKKKPRISREAIIRYLNRYTLKKKQPIIRPRTFVNSQTLTTARLQSSGKKAPQIQKPIINNNVKARLESNLEYLLEHQNANIKRVRPAESFISLKFNNPKQPVNMKRNDNVDKSSQSNNNKKSESIANKTQSEDSFDCDSFSFSLPFKGKQCVGQKDSSSSHKKINTQASSTFLRSINNTSVKAPKKNINRDSFCDESFGLLKTSCKPRRTKTFSPFVFNSSFDFVTTKDQIRASDRNAQSQSRFENDFSKNIGDDFGFDDPACEPSTVYPTDFEFCP